MAEDFNIDQLYEMALTAKPYLRTSLERMRASITTLESDTASKAFANYLRKVIVADHTDAMTLMDRKWPEEK